MSWYYKQEFISPQPIFARVKEELRSYFEAGLVDDLMFPIWNRDCVKRFRKSALPIEEVLLFVDDFEARLPPDFDGVREAWGCFFNKTLEFRTSGSYYKAITTIVDTTADECQLAICNPPCQTDCEPCGEANSFQTVYKTNESDVVNFKITYLLRPGNISARECCANDCKNIGSDSANTFDIKDGKLVTNFRQGDVYLIYYAKELDGKNFEMIPDNYFFSRYLEMYLKWKVFKQISNQVSDETFNQIMVKVREADLEQAEAFVMAEQEFRSQTLQQKINSIGANRRRLNRYRIR